MPHQNVRRAEDEPDRVHRVHVLEQALERVQFVAVGVAQLAQLGDEGGVVVSEQLLAAHLAAQRRVRRRAQEEGQVEAWVRRQPGQLVVQELELFVVRAAERRKERKGMNTEGGDKRGRGVKQRYIRSGNVVREGSLVVVIFALLEDCCVSSCRRVSDRS